MMLSSLRFRPLGLVPAPAPGAQFRVWTHGSIKKQNQHPTDLVQSGHLPRHHLAVLAGAVVFGLALAILLLNLARWARWARWAGSGVTNVRMSIAALPVTVVIASVYLGVKGGVADAVEVDLLLEAADQLVDVELRTGPCRCPWWR